MLAKKLRLTLVERGQKGVGQIYIYLNICILNKFGGKCDWMQLHKLSESKT